MNRALFVILLVGFTVTTMFYAAERPKTAQPKEERPKAERKLDSTGRKLESGKDAVKVADVPTRKMARFELYDTTSVGFKWEIAVVFDPRVYPYKVLGGKIAGSIRGAPNWEITEGTFGHGLMLKAKNTKPEPGSADFVVITGSSAHPSSYTGSFELWFDGEDGASFKHNTLLLGFSDP